MTVGAWARWYTGAKSRPYLIDGDDLTYRMGAEWLSGMQVADWGAGLGWLRNYVPEHLYTGIDGTESVYADIVTDLATYDVPSQAVFMRHVLEHDERWGSILGNAVRAAQEKLFLVIYTPMVKQTHVHLYEPTLGVPEIHFCLSDIRERLVGKVEILMVGQETVFQVTK